MGRQHQGMDRPGVRKIRQGRGEQGKMGEAGCEIICGAPTTLAVKEQMMMMMRLGEEEDCKRGTVWQNEGKTDP